mgnify:CR=1 FL=1
MNYYDARETRDPAERERDLLARLPVQVAHAQARTPAFARLLAEVDAAAVTSREALASLPVIRKDFMLEPYQVAEARAIGATCGGVRVWSLYVPNGRTLEDPHLPYKLKWLSALRDTATGWLADDPSLPLALMGDWNIAPTDEDVWDMAEFQNSTHVSEPERAAFRAMNDAGFADVVRPFTPGPGVYTYWDYTQLRFPKKQGMRIDFVLGSPEFAARVKHGEIVREERKGKQPSDHAPVLVELEK